MRTVENSHATYQKLNKFYKRKLKFAKNYAGSMNKYMSKAEGIVSKADSMKSETDAKSINLIGLALKATLFAVIARYWQHRIHRCANKVENLADKHLDFWTGSGEDYYKEIMMLDPDYKAEVERKEYERRERKKHYINHGDGGYDTSFFPY